MATDVVQGDDLDLLDVLGGLEDAALAWGQQLVEAVGKDERPRADGARGSLQIAAEPRCFPDIVPVDRPGAVNAIAGVGARGALRPALKGGYHVLARRVLLLELLCGPAKGGLNVEAKTGAR